MKIKEGGGMDIQKEREAFQKFCEENFDFENHEQTYFDEQTQCYENDIGEDTESINMAWMAWQAAKAQAVPEGFVLISAEQLNQWGHMANYAEQYGCPECFEARGYAHSLACEINEFFAIEAQEPANEL